MMISVINVLVPSAQEAEGCLSTVYSSLNENGIFFISQRNEIHNSAGRDIIRDHDPWLRRSSGRSKLAIGDGDASGLFSLGVISVDSVVMERVMSVNVECHIYKGLTDSWVL